MTAVPGRPPRCYCDEDPWRRACTWCAETRPAPPDGLLEHIGGYREAPRVEAAHEPVIASERRVVAVGALLWLAMAAAEMVLRAVLP